MSNTPRCSFRVRTPVESQPGKFRYDTIVLKNQYGVSLVTPHPPLPGDLVFLEGAVYEVIGRMWNYPDYGSADWRMDTDEPQWGPLLDVIVIPAKGLYADEAETEEETPAPGLPEGHVIVGTEIDWSSAAECWECEPGNPCLRHDGELPDLPFLW